MAAPTNAKQLVFFSQEESEEEFIAAAKDITKLFSRMGQVSVESARTPSCLHLGKVLCQDLGCKLSIQGVWDPVLTPGEVFLGNEICASVLPVQANYFPYEITGVENERMFQDRVAQAVFAQSDSLRFVCTASSVVNAVLNVAGISDNSAPIFVFIDLNSPRTAFKAVSVPDMLRFSPPLPNVQSTSMTDSLVMDVQNGDLQSPEQALELVYSEDIPDPAGVKESSPGKVLDAFQTAVPDQRVDPMPLSFFYESSGGDALQLPASNGLPLPIIPEQFESIPKVESIPEAISESALSQSTISRMRVRSTAENEAAKLTDIINEDLAKTICESLSTFNRSKEARESEKRLDQANLALESLKTRFEQVSGLLLKRVGDMQGLSDGQAFELKQLISQFQTIGKQRQETESALETLTQELIYEAKTLRRAVDEKLAISQKITQELDDLKAKQGGKREFPILIQGVQTGHDGTQVVKVICKKHYGLWVFVHVQGPNGFTKRDFRSLTPGAVDVPFGNINEYAPGDYSVNFEQLETYKPLSDSATFQIDQFASIPVLAPTYEDSYLYKNVANIKELEDQLGPAGAQLLQRFALAWVNAEETFLDDFISTIVDSYQEGERALYERLLSKGYQFSGQS